MSMRTMTTVAAATTLALTLIGCEREPQVEVFEEPVETPIEGTAGEGVRVADIQEDPGQFAGRTITIVSEVDRVVGPRAFFLDEEAPLEGGVDQDLLVLTRATADTATAAEAEEEWIDESVRVTGTVQVLTLVELEREVGWDLNPEIEAELQGQRPVLIADSVLRVVQ